VFVGDALALDLVNTEMMVRRKPCDLLVTSQDVARWWQAARRQHPDAASVAGADLPMADELVDLAALKALRSALRGMFEALANGAAPSAQEIAAVNAILATGAPTLVLTPEGMTGVGYRCRPGASAMRFAIAISALRLVQEGDRQRLHRCSNNRCVLLFYDTTRSATRRWCSLSCMDRARSAQRYLAAKQRQ
jgi:predicted RNA-binding Zn ribbon-like protein